MRIRLAVAVAVALTVCAACSSTNGGHQHSTATPGPNDATVASMLALLPDNATTTGSPVVVNLYWKAARAGRVTIPAATADESALSKYVGRLNDNDVAVAASTLTQQINEYGAQTEKQTGFNAADLAADTEVQAAPNSYLAVRGHFDRKAADAGLRADPHWKSVLKTPKYHGTTVYSWLKDNAVDMSNVHTGLFTDIGQSRRFAFPNDSTFLYGKSDGVIHDLLDATGGDTNTLDAAKDYRAAAAALDGQNVYSAQFIRPPSIADYLETLRHRSPPPPASVITAIRTQLSKHALAPYQLAAIGVTIKNGKPTIVVAVVNADNKAAQANASRLRDVVGAGSSPQTNTAWSTSFSVRQTTVSGAVTVGLLEPRSGSAAAWRQLPNDSLLLHS